MESLAQPKTLKVYALIKQSSLSFTPVRSMANNGIGAGFFLSREEAEHNRTLEILTDNNATGKKPTWHIFELEFPNPAYQE